MLTKIETSETDPGQIEDKDITLPEDGIYLHDMVAPDYDSALDISTAISKLHEDDVHEKPGAGFHDEGMYGEGERQSDGALLNEATGEAYKDDLDDTTIFAKQLGGIIIESELETNLDDPDDPTEKWLKMVENNSGPDAQRRATAEWIKHQKHQ